MANLDLIVLENGRRKRKPSQDQTLTLTGLQIGSLAAITESSGKLDLGGSVLSNVGEATQSGELVTWGQVQTYVGQEAVSGGAVKQQLLTQRQLDDTLGIIPGTVFFLTVQPTADDTITFTDGTNTETYKFVASASATYDVTIGADVAESMSNLAAAIGNAVVSGDSSLWHAYYDDASLDSIYVNGVIGIYRLAITDFRMYVTQGGSGTIAGLVGDFSVESQYKTDVVPTAIPSSDPASAFSGFKLAKANLANGEQHNVLAEDKIFSWNEDANSGAGEWFILAEGTTPIASSTPGNTVLGKVTADEDAGLVINGSGVMSVKVDASTIDFNGSGQLYIPNSAVGSDQLAALSVTEGKIVDAAVSTDKIAGSAVTSDKISGLAVTSSKIGTGAVTETKIGAAAVTADKIAGTAVTAAKLGSDVAGTGLSGGNGSALSVSILATSDTAKAAVLAIDPGGLYLTIDTAKFAESANALTLAASSVTSTELASNAVTTAKITDGNVTGAKLAATSVTASKLGSDVITGDGLTGGNGSAIGVNLLGTTSGTSMAVLGQTGGLHIVANSTHFQEDTGIFKIKAAGIGSTELAGTSVTAAKLNSNVISGGGLTGANGSAIELSFLTSSAGSNMAVLDQTDGLHIKANNAQFQDNAAVLEIKPAGISSTELAGTSVTAAKLASDVISGGGLTGANGSAIELSLLSSTSGGDMAVLDQTNGLHIKANSGQFQDNAGSLEIKPSGISSTELAGASVTAAKLASSVITGDGLTGADGSAIELNILGSSASSALAVLSQTGGLHLEVNTSHFAESGNALGLADNAVATAKIAATAVTAAKLGSDVAGNGLTGGNGSALAVQALGTTDLAKAAVIGVETNGVYLSISTDHFAESTNALQIKAGGVSSTELGTGAVTEAKIGTGAVTSAKLGGTSVTAAKLGSDVAGNGLTGGNGSALAAQADTTGGANLAKAINVSSNGIAIKVDDVSIKENGSGQISVSHVKSLQNDNASAITALQLVYIKSNGNVDLAKADIANFDQVALGVVLASSIAAAASGEVVVRSGAIISGFSNLTPGLSVYVSPTTAGDYQQSPTTGFEVGDFVYSIGRAVSDTEVHFNPEFIIEY